MFEELRSLFAPMPNAGDIFRLDMSADSIDPFDEEDIRVVILEVRRGWVKYTHVHKDSTVMKTVTGKCIDFTLPWNKFKKLYIKL